MGFRRYPIHGLFSFLAALLLMCGGVCALAGDAVLTWNPSVSEDIVGYKVYAGNASRLYGSPIMVGNQTQYTMTGLINGAWYFAVTAVDIEGDESDYSNEVTKSIGAASDTAPPVISGITSLSITKTGATIAWATNEAAKSQVEFGTTTAYGKSSALNNSLLTAHSHALSGLASGTLYHYRVKSTDAAGNLAVSGDYTFKTVTQTATDTTSPVISAISSTGITSTGATIVWATNESSDSQVEYGTTTAYGKSTTLNASPVTAHSQVLSGLSENTLYHYRVKSKDASGNPAVSPDYTFTTASGNEEPSVFARWFRSDAVQAQADSNAGPDPYAAFGTGDLKSQDPTSHTLNAGVQKPTGAASYLSRRDKTPPKILGIGSLGVSNSGATIVWNTSERSNTEVEYGTTTGYECGSVVTQNAVKTHAQKLTGLRAGTRYHYRVRSRDIAGNAAVSNDRVFTTTASGTAPVISAISVSDVTGQSARISWITDKASNTEVEYQPAAGTALKAALGELVTQHSITLNNLEPETRYRFNVRSEDHEGIPARSVDYSLTTVSGGSPVAALPRFFDLQDQNDLGDEVFTQIAVTNLGDRAATLVLTAVDGDGNTIAGQDIVNPNGFQVGAQAQAATLDLDLFGDGLGLSASRGWIRMESTSSDMGGFALAFGSNLSFLEATSLEGNPLTDFAFAEIEANGTTRINVANNNPVDASVVFDLVKADGTVGSSQSRIIKANGALVADLFEDLFPGVERDASNYVRVNSTEGVLSFALMKKDSGDMAALSGQDVTAGGTVLYAPHYVAGSDYRTLLSVMNLDAKAGKVQFQFVGENGVQIGATRAMEIPANGKLHINDAAFFRQRDTVRTYTGYVRISSDGVRLAGSAVFGDSGGRSFSSALPLIYSPQKSVLYGHAVSNDLYSSGIAIVNPNSTGVQAVIELFAADGASIGKKSEFIAAGQRKAKLLTEYFPSREGQDQTSGYVKITSDKPLASFSLFGTENLSVLSAIPAKVIPQ